MNAPDSINNHEPLRRSYSHEEAIDVAKQWMRDNYGWAHDLSAESRDRYYTRLGLLVDFLHALFSPNDKDQP